MNVHNALCSLTSLQNKKVSPDVFDFMKDFVGKSIVIIMKPSYDGSIESTNVLYRHSLIYAVNVGSQKPRKLRLLSSTKGEESRIEL